MLEVVPAPVSRGPSPIFPLFPLFLMTGAKILRQPSRANVFFEELCNDFTNKLKCSKSFLHRSLTDIPPFFPYCFSPFCYFPLFSTLLLMIGAEILKRPFRANAFFFEERCNDLTNKRKCWKSFLHRSLGDLPPFSPFSPSFFNDRGENSKTTFSRECVFLKNGVMI